MKLHTLDKVKISGRRKIPGYYPQEIADKARKAVERMLEVSL